MDTKGMSTPRGYQTRKKRGDTDVVKKQEGSSTSEPFEWTRKGGTEKERQRAVKRLYRKEKNWSGPGSQCSQGIKIEHSTTFPLC